MSNNSNKVSFTLFPAIVNLDTITTRINKLISSIVSKHVVEYSKNSMKFERYQSNVYILYLEMLTQGREAELDTPLCNATQYKSSNHSVFCDHFNSVISRGVFYHET